MKTITNIIAAAIIACTASLAAAQGVTVADDVVDAGALSMSLNGSFTMAADVTLHGEGLVIGNPGRATLAIEGGKVVFTIGGEVFDGIERDTYSTMVRVPEGAVSVRIEASYDGENMVLRVTDRAITRAQRTNAPEAGMMLEQLSMMEEIMGGGECSHTLVFGNPEACGSTAPAYTGTISGVVVQ
ncbi:MAG: hypothetical protein ACJA1R_001391 [Flavobacteriales bacterium]|jgi:hypothetical protein